MSGTGVLKALQSRGVDAHAFDPGAQTLAELEAARFDRVFIALHGRGGEDGTIQGVLETLRRAVHRQRRAGVRDRDRQARDQASVAAGRHSDAALPGADERRPRGTERGGRRPRPAADHQAAARGFDDRHREGRRLLGDGRRVRAGREVRQRRARRAVHRRPRTDVRGARRRRNGATRAAADRDPRARRELRLSQQVLQRRHASTSVPRRWTTRWPPRSSGCACAPTRCSARAAGDEST